MDSHSNWTSFRSRSPLLRGIELEHAALSGADLYRADLTDGDLSGTKGVTDKQLAKVKSLKDATMPNGQKYEDWLKSKGREEDRENITQHPA